MPSDIRLLRLPQVLELVGLSRSTVYQKICSGEFPRPVPLSTSAIGFVSGEIHDWVAARIAERDQALAAR
jgi:prophage regulatory protein